VTVVPVVPPLEAHVRVPGSKSLSNRALLLACLGRGPCRYDDRYPLHVCMIECMGVCMYVCAYVCVCESV
jgi:hypothetical protein